MSNNHGTWATMRFHCGDGRIQRAVLEYAESFGGLSDPVVAPGGVKKFLEDEVYRAKVLEDLKTYSSLHNPHTLLVLQHEDCGAYGGKSAFSGDQSETEFHKGRLQEAIKVLNQHFPDLKVVGGFVLLSGEVIPMNKLSLSAVS